MPTPRPVPSNVTLSASLLARLGGVVAFPNPDDAAPVGPGGPVIRARGDIAALNPQPLPPKETARETWGPQPEPWAWASSVRSEISRQADRVELAGIIIVGGDQEAPLAAARASITQLVDDFCGTPPRPRPFPGPWGPKLDAELDATRLLIAGAQFQQAAEALDGQPLAEVFADAATQLFETAAKRG